MKYNLLAVGLFFSALIFSSCESHEKKVDDAYDRVKEIKNTIKDTVKIYVKAEKVLEEKKKVIVKTETVDEWTLFKSETEDKIIASEDKIKELKLKKNSAENKAKFDRQITRLEQKNNDLRKRMNDYNQEVKVKWEKFKMEMNHDIDAIGIELKDVTINNKKVKK